MRRINDRWRGHWPQQAAEGAGKRWQPTAMLSMLVAQESLTESISETTPSNSVLLAASVSDAHQPPQAWWDEDNDPFAADNE